MKMDRSLRNLFEKSSDPALNLVARLDDIIREIVEDGIKRGESYSVELDKIGDELSRREMLHDALCAVSLKDRRKKAGVKRDSDQFAPFKRLMEYVHREEATVEVRSEEDEAVRKGMACLREHGKTLLPELQTRLDVYGLRAGKLYRENDRTAWIPFSWDYGTRLETKVVTLKIDHVSKTHKVLRCHPAFMELSPAGLSGEVQVQENSESFLQDRRAGDRSRVTDERFASGGPDFRRIFRLHE